MQLLENLRAVLSRLTAAQYGRDNQLDDQVLDDALDSGLSVLRRLKVENARLKLELRELQQGANRPDPQLGRLRVENERLREELAAREGGPAPQHAALREIGYLGWSEMLRFRPAGVGL